MLTPYVASDKVHLLIGRLEARPIEYVLAGFQLDILGLGPSGQVQQSCAAAVVALKPKVSATVASCTVEHVVVVKPWKHSPFRILRPRIPRYAASLMVHPVATISTSSVCRSVSCSSLSAIAYLKNPPCVPPYPAHAHMLSTDNSGRTPLRGSGCSLLSHAPAWQSETRALQSKALPIRVTIPCGAARTSLPGWQRSEP